MSLPSHSRSVKPLSLGLKILTLALGLGLNLILAPLAADMFYEVEILADSHPDTFGAAGAYAQAYSLLCCAIGSGTALGPVLAGALLEGAGWQITQSVLAIVCAFGSLGVFRYTGRVGCARKKVRFEALPDGV